MQPCSPGPKPSLLCGVRPRARLTVRLLCRGSLWGPAGGSTGPGHQKAGGEKALAPSRLPAVPAAALQPPASQQSRTNQAQGVLLLGFFQNFQNQPPHIPSELLGSHSSLPSDPPGCPLHQQGCRQLLLTVTAAVLPQCSLVIFLALQWLFNQLSTFKISQFT